MSTSRRYVGFASSASASALNKPAPDPPKLLTGLDAKLDTLAKQCASLACELARKADSESVQRVERGLLQVRVQLYGAALALGVVEALLWLRR